MARDHTFDRDGFSPREARKMAEDARRVATGFWRKLASVAARLPFVDELVAAYYCALDSKTPLRVRMALFGALAYFVMPFDVAPDLLLGIGFADDAAVLFGTLKLIGSHVTEAHRTAARAALARLRAGDVPPDDIS